MSSTSLYDCFVQGGGFRFNGNVTCSIGRLVAAIWSPTTMLRAVVPSCARVIVSVSFVTAVTSTISALEANGCEPVGKMVTSNGGVGNRDPWPAVTVSDVPEDAGDGAVATVLKFADGFVTPSHAVIVLGRQKGVEVVR
jgi:hypothetical protein